MRFIFILALCIPSLAPANAVSRDEILAEANKYIQTKNLSAAETLYRSCLEQNPADIECKFFLAQVVAWQERFSEAQKLYSEVLEVRPDYHDAELGLGRVEYWDGKLRNSLERLDRLCEIEPDNLEVRQQREQVLAAIDEQKLLRVRFATNFTHMNFFDEPSFGFRAGFSSVEKRSWALRADAYALRRFGIGAFQGTLGGSYWLMPSWVIELDGEAATNGEVVPQFATTLGTSLTIAKTITPSFAFRYANYLKANTFSFAPGVAWSIVPQLEIKGQLFAGLTTFSQSNTVSTFAGLGRVTYTPSEYFSVFAGYSAGQEAFDPGNPTLGTGRFFAQHAFGGMRFELSTHYGAILSFDAEWRNSGQRLLGGEIGAFAAW